MRILLVEDNLLIAVSLQRVLEAWGHEATLGRSPDEALARARASKPELVLMDIDLGAERDGVDTMRAIHEAVGFVPHIYLTGFAPKDAGKGARATRPNGYLEKPVWPEDLRALIEAIERRPD